MPDASPPDWRSPDSPEPSGARPWQTSDATPAETTGSLSRRGVKRAIAAIALVGIAIGIGVVISLLRAQRPACLILVGSGYEQNLLLPPNVHGWNGGLRLLKDDDITEAEGFSDRFRWSQPTTMRRVEKPFELKEQAWPETWEKIAKEIGKGTDKENVVLFFSLHGYADDSEAYLLRNVPDVQSPEAFKLSRTAFADVLKSLKEVKDKNVVLLLDVCHVQAHWPIGMLRNDFAERLKGYDKEIAAMGNLTVICSAGPKERSWAAEEEQMSVFAYFVAQGLKGAGQREQERITAAKLFEFVEANVKKWASVNRARRQTPFILGAKAAEQVELVRVVKPYQKADAKARTLDAEGLKTAWANWKRLKHDQAPHVHSPHIWRQYHETLLRYEQLVRAGDPTGAAPDLKKNLDALAAEITKARALDEAFACLGNSFPIHRVLGFRPKEPIADQALKDYLEHLNKGNDDDKNKVLERLLSKSRDDRRYWQTLLSHRLLTEQPDDQRFVRTAMRKHLAQIASDLDVPQRAAEVHLVKLLDQVEPAFDKLDEKGETVRLAVRVRMLAEEVALSVPGANEPGELYAEAIFRTIRGDVKEADAQRRAAEDALFAEPGKKHLEDVHGRFATAQQSYKAAGIKAQKLRSAMALRDDVSADLPFLAPALAQLPAVDQQARADIDALRLAAEALGNGLAELSSDLDKPDTLPRAVDRPAKNLQDLRAGWQKICTALAAQEGKLLQKNWHALDGVLAIPPMDNNGDVELRMRLVTKLRELSAELSSRPLTEKHPDEEDEDSLERQRTLLAAWLKAWRGPNPAAESVDASVREFFLKLPAEIKNADGAKDEKVLAAAASRCRVVPGALAEHVRDKQAKRINPVERLRKLRTSDLLLWLAERTVDDHWFEPDPKGDKLEDATYYLPVAKAYQDSAAGLVKDRASVKEPIQAGLTFAGTPSRYWTTEPVLPLTWHVGAQDGVPPGAPVVWLDVKKGSKRAEPWRVRAREIVDPWPVPKPYAASFELKKGDFIENTDVDVAFHALYRGQHLIEKLTLHCPAPDVIVRHTPGPEKVGFAVRMDSDFDYGAISIVLDNSGSMKYAHPAKRDKDGTPLEADLSKKPPERRRFDYALDALEHVLKRVPDKTKLSIFKLGREKYAGEREDVQGVMRQPVPESWWLDRKSLLDSLYKLPANLNSPIAEGIVASMKGGFPEGHKGPRIILVLTDGDDNLSFGSSHNGKDDKQIKRHTQKVVDELEEAYKNHKEVRVIVVCFIQEDDPEYKRAGDQFSCVEQFRPNRGRFKRVAQARDLGTTIEDFMRPHVQLTRRPEGSAAPGFENGTPVNYYHADKSLDWKPVSAGNFQAGVLDFPGDRVGVEMPRGHNIFALLKRQHNDLFLERAVVGKQPEVRDYPSTPRDGWLVTLLENHRALAGNSISQTLLFEKTEPEKDLRQTHPGFTWLELDPQKGKRPEETLEWRNSKSLPAQALQLKMPWPAEQAPKVTAWFWPDERAKLLEASKLLTHRKVQIPHVPEGPADPIESIRTERRTLGPGTAEKDFLVVRLRYPERKPIFALLRDYPLAGAEHRHFLGAGKSTAYFHDLPPALNEVNLVLIDVEAFKAASRTSKVEFMPDRELAVPAIFRFEARE